MDKLFEEKTREEREEELMELMKKDEMEKHAEERRLLSYMLGSELHEEWRSTRKNPDGTYEPRWKKSKDEAWNKMHGTDDVDIANTEFKDLPSNWQFENLEAAKVAIDTVFGDVMTGETIDDEKMEEMASKVHEAWVGRNDWVKDPEWGDPVLAGAYKDLPEEEKEKDRAQLRLAIQYVESYKKQGKDFLEEARRLYGTESR